MSELICRAGFSRGVSYVILADGNEVEVKLHADIFPFKKNKRLMTIDDASVWVDKEIMRMKGTRGEGF